MDLGDYLAAARLKPWEPRVHDCCAFPAGWAEAPLPEYSTDEEAEEMLLAAGGLVPLWEAALQGLADQVTDLEPGDVGVIELVAPDLTLVEVGAIWTGKRWAFAPRAGGLAATSSANCLKAWRPLCHKR